MENTAVAVIENGAVYFVRTDHIGRPVLATDATAAVVWEASYLPFGGVHTSTGANSALRFPGQWYQSESGLHQNWMRDYDPTTGRYIQADPLGLVDGASVYGYALQNPNGNIDPRGEQSLKPGFSPPLPPVFIPGTPESYKGGKALSDAISYVNPFEYLFRSLFPDRYNDGNIVLNDDYGGSQSFPAPYDHDEEQAALDFPTIYPPDDGYCARLKQAIWILRANIAWRIGDLNRLSATYQGHARRVATLKFKLKRLEEHYELVCGGVCPPEPI